MVDKIYVVIGEEGEWEEHSTWNVCWYASHEDAKKACEKLQAEIDDLTKRYNEWLTRYNEFHSANRVENPSHDYPRKPNLVSRSEWEKDPKFIAYQEWVMHSGRQFEEFCKRDPNPLMMCAHDPVETSYYVDEIERGS